MSKREWTEIERLRTVRPAAAQNTQRINELLDDLAAHHDVDALIQREIARYDESVREGRVNTCEGFASLLGSLAAAVYGRPVPDSASGPLGTLHDEHLRWGDPNRWEFLQLAWAYLVSHSDHVNYHDLVSVHVGREPVGGYEGSEPDWVTTHSDAGTGSGFMQPRSDDRFQDQNGRKAHFIANAIAAYRFGVAGESAARAAWAAMEESTTDNDVNRLGSEFGHALATGQVDPGTIAEWIRKNLCTEKRKWTGTDEYLLEQPVYSGLQRSEGKVELLLEEDQEGRLKGTAEGFVTADLYLTNCRSTTLKPGRLHAKLEGKRTEGAMELRITSESWEEIEISPCQDGLMPSVIGGGRIHFLHESLQRLEQRTPGEYRHERRETIGRGSTGTVSHTVVVRRAE